MNMHAPILSFAHDPLPPRAGNAAVREEALRALADLGEALPLTAWRGRSGRRYVVSIIDSGEAPPADGSGVLLAIARAPCGSGVLLGSIGLCGSSSSAEEPDGTARPCRSVADPVDAPALEVWCAIMRQRGACEWHLHLLATSRLAQEAMRADLAVLPRTTSTKAA